MIEKAVKLLTTYYIYQIIFSVWPKFLFKIVS